MRVDVGFFGETLSGHGYNMLLYDFMKELEIYVGFEGLMLNSFVAIICEVHFP